LVGKREKMMVYQLGKRRDSEKEMKKVAQWVGWLVNERGPNSDDPLVGKKELQTESRLDEPMVDEKDEKLESNLVVVMVFLWADWKGVHLAVRMVFSLVEQLVELLEGKSDEH
jgi:hypothetical protein